MSEIIDFSKTKSTLPSKYSLLDGERCIKTDLINKNKTHKRYKDVTPGITKVVVSSLLVVSVSYFVFLLLIFSTTWIVLYSFSPTFVKVTIRGDLYARPNALPDPIKCTIYAVIFSLLSILVLFVITRLWAEH